MKEFILVGVAGGCFGFAVARFILGDFPVGYLGILCAIGFYMTHRETERSEE